MEYRDRNSGIRQADIGARLCEFAYGDVDVVEELAAELWASKLVCRVSDISGLCASKRDARVSALSGAFVETDELLRMERKGAERDVRYESGLVTAIGRLLDLYYMIKREGEGR